MGGGVGEEKFMNKTLSCLCHFEFWSVFFSCSYLLTGTSHRIFNAFLMMQACLSWGSLASASMPLALTRWNPCFGIWRTLTRVCSWLLLFSLARHLYMVSYLDLFCSVSFTVQLINFEQLIGYSVISGLDFLLCSLNLYQSNRKTYRNIYFTCFSVKCFVKVLAKYP